MTLESQYLIRLNKMIINILLPFALFLPRQQQQCFFKYRAATLSNIYGNLVSLNLSEIP
jgi:hypothetical protein